MNLESHTYISLGGPFLEDFRLVHSRLGIRDMVCVEEEESVHRRQLFNRPAPCVMCKNDTLEGFIDKTEFTKPVILWFDYTDPKAIKSQIERFLKTIRQVPLYSVLRITLNANPGSLGQPYPKDIQPALEGAKDPDDERPTLHEWRLRRFKDRMGGYFPQGIEEAKMDHAGYGKAILKCLELAVNGLELPVPDRKAVCSLATQYADGQQMVTATFLILPKENKVEDVLLGWGFQSTSESPLLIQMPVLSTRERLTLESNDALRGEIAYDFGDTALDGAQLESFKRYYRMFPHFSRVDF